MRLTQHGAPSTAALDEALESGTVVVLSIADADRYRLAASCVTIFPQNGHPAPSRFDGVPLRSVVATLRMVPLTVSEAVSGRAGGGPAVRRHPKHLPSSHGPPQPVPEAR
ncbi:hypothetical protein GCM10010278_21420 [Streptomyces melanogenes]|nr:hypothetical protein GCM10010278_21420 [Streptomyces melanogenes]